MQRQLALKGICSIDEWKEIREKIHYDFMKDNHFTELKDIELLATRINMLNMIQPYMGTYFSRNYARKHVLNMDDEEIEHMDEEIYQEAMMQQQAMAAQQQSAAPAAQQPQQPQQDVNAAFNEITK
jgi:hypothetical protein